MRQELPEQFRAAAVCLAIFLAGCAQNADATGSAGPSPGTGASKQDHPANRLGHESSPYLLQHAHNPVDWFPWSDEAFAKAKKENKLIFLSIGYSSCHWCHVMERESFENPEIARLLNDWFIAIKVDREERPDIDNVYMTALHVQGQRGGWPLTMFLLPDGRPIAGGTYWPPDDRAVEGDTIPGLKTVLRRAHETYEKMPQELEKRAGQVAAATRTALAQAASSTNPVKLGRNLVDRVLDGIKEEYDTDFGGFGSSGRHFQGPKFPSPCYLQLLLLETARTHSAELGSIITGTLDHMARGGIYDQLGGGFHRYSTERTWTVPHFEKMLYDNAQLVEIYAEAFQQTGNPLYRRIVAETLAFVKRELTAPDGGFYSALDADSDGGEGLYYLWTDGDIEAALGSKADADFVKQVYGASTGLNFEGKYHILVLPTTSGTDLDRLAPLRQKLLEYREKRPRPFLDTKVLAAWNGQMIAGYAVAGQILGEPRYLEAASRAADFILTRMLTKDGRLLRTYNARPRESGQARLAAYLDDHAFLVHGLLCLHDATGESRWLEQARSLTDSMVRLFGDQQDGGFFYTAKDQVQLFARSKDRYDGVQPSGNSMAAQNLVRVWHKTHERHYRDLAERTLKSFAAPLEANPTSLAAMAWALDLFQEQHEPAVRRAFSPGPEVSQDGSSRSDSKVEATASVEPKTPGPEGKQVVTVTLKIESGWHIYANPADNDEVTPTTVTVSARIKPREVKVDYPRGKLIDNKGSKYRLYEDQVMIKATVKRAAGDSGPLEISVKFQACNENSCLFPSTKKLTLP
jgi:uncharacterized protein YyaL (SSP411 family)